MLSSITSAALLCLLAGAGAVAPDRSVFLDKQQASSLISRQKRNAAGSTLEQVCMENICTYEQARAFFQDSYRADIFWAVYVDGDQCAEKPCKNGAMCSDSVGGYDCVCKSGFTGVHCEKDETLCVVDSDKGCSQFCKPGYTSHECSCAQGWKISGSDKTKCVPTGRFSCGRVSSVGQWESRMATNKENNFQGISCTSGECPWQALLKTSASPGFCSGVILKANLVLTSAQCARKYSSFQVAVGKRSTSYEAGERTLRVKRVHVHPRFVEGRPDNDLAVVELSSSITYNKDTIAACLPEKDFAENVLMKLPTAVTGWEEAKEEPSLQGPLMLNHLTYVSLADCLEAHPNLLTNKMGCTLPLANANCTMGSGSPLLTVYKEVLFLTGVVSQPAGADCSKGYIVQKVSRYQSWLQSLMNLR
ncbi:unnamed protein product [Tetraodon nigroviridis]|uniref:(spotted green pufferfish) hypothetical protein n=1 Tax=Tetraodon nigroviridis TaxID=99883 RepID=Q4RJM2_TETNG|nr:unnamed protein product [Tetraodon nigroviridis]